VCSSYLQILSINNKHFSAIKVFKGNSIDGVKDLEGFANKIIISISQDSIKYTKLDSLLKKQLSNKNIAVDFRLNHSSGDSIIFKSDANNIALNWGDHKTTLKEDNVFFNWKSVDSKSTFLKNNEKIRLLFKDSSFEALKRSSTGILLSLLLSLAIISCLFYLLKIINKQKELAEIKNDLISNITHEFKTPITTVSTAIEAISTFNAIDDKEKTRKYLSISSLQLTKLHHMVEKLLDTATLDSETLLLQKEEVDIVELVKTIVLRNDFHSEEKNIHFIMYPRKTIGFVRSFSF